MADASLRLRNVFLGIAGLLFVGGGLLFLASPEAEPRAPEGDEAALRSVRAHRVEAAPVEVRVEVAGVLEPRRSVQLLSETRGPVVEVGAEALDRVVAGQLLMRVDPLLAEVAVERAAAAVARAESELSLARSNLQRRRGLKEQGVASDADLEDAENAERVALASLRLSRAELRQAEDDLAKKTLRAPFEGVLRSFSVEVGEYVQDGRELGELLDLSAARATIGVADREVVAVQAGQPVELRVPAHPEQIFRGTVLRVGAASDPESRKFPVEVEVPNPDGRLLPGMVASVTLELGDSEPRRLIPREATVEEFGLRFVWVLAQEQDATVAHRRRVEVRPVPFHPAEFEVVSGLGDGDRIALGGLRQLREGEAVRLDGSGS